jgi:hypothetical protein
MKHWFGAGESVLDGEWAILLPVSEPFRRSRHPEFCYE